MDSTVEYQAKNAEFLSSPFSLEAVELLEKVGVSS